MIKFVIHNSYFPLGLSCKSTFSKQVLVIIAVCIVFLPGLTLFAQTVYVPMNHWVYDFIDRLESQRHIEYVLNNTKPMSRSEIGQILDRIITTEAKSAFLNSVEKNQLEYLKFEFREELPIVKDTGYLYESRLKKFCKIKPADAVYCTCQIFLFGFLAI